jgi:serine protease AprX
VTLTISTARHTPKCSYLVLVGGTSVGITHSGGVRLNIGSDDERFEDFGGTITPSSQTVVPGSRATYQVTVLPLNGFDSDVRLRIRDLPPGATATFAPDVVPGGSGFSTLTITTTNATPAASYHVVITGEGGGHHHKDGVDLIAGPAQ